MCVTLFTASLVSLVVPGKSTFENMSPSPDNVSIYVRTLHCAGVHIVMCLKMRSDNILKNYNKTNASLYIVYLGSNISFIHVSLDLTDRESFSNVLIVVLFEVLSVI